MRVTVSKWGNSLGIRIPRGLAQDVQMDEGSIVDLRVEDGRLIVEPSPAPSLEALVARITPENCHGELLNDEPIGREAW